MGGVISETTATSTVIAVNSGLAVIAVQYDTEKPRVLQATQLTTPVIVSAGIPGIPGPPGPPGGGSGVTYVQDFAPANPLEQQTWYNPLTLQLKVYSSAAWRPVSPDGGHF